MFKSIFLVCLSTLSLGVISEEAEKSTSFIQNWGAGVSCSLIDGIANQAIKSKSEGVSQESFISTQIEIEKIKIDSLEKRGLSAVAKGMREKHDWKLIQLTLVAEIVYAGDYNNVSPELTNILNKKCTEASLKNGA